MIEFVLLGFMSATWLFTIVAAGYGGYRYVYRPWKIMRADVASLADQIGLIKEEMGLRKAMTLSDEEQATMERRARARQLWGGGNAPVPPMLQAPR